MRNNANFIVTLPAEINLDESKNIQGQIINFLKSPHKRARLVLQADAVKSLSLCGVQLLLSTRKSCKERGINFMIKSPSDYFKQISEDLGCWEIFNSRTK